MQNDDLTRLRHMLDAVREAESFIRGKTRNSLDTDRQLVLALVKSVEIIGEAAGRINPELKKEIPQIQWAEIISMRNRLIHAYFDINLDTLWNTVVQDFPPLIAELEKIIQG